MRSKRQGIAISVFTGIAAFFLLPLMLWPILDRPDWLYLPVLSAAYFLIAVVIGYFWPPVGWKTGLWLFLPWPPALLFAEFLSADKPWDWKGDLLSLAAYASMLVAACLGGWLGAVISKRRGKEFAPSSSDER
jgi:hypothetical protein